MKNYFIRHFLRVWFFLMSFLIRFQNFFIRKFIRWRWKKIIRPLHGPLPYEDQIPSLELAFQKMKDARWVETSGTRSEPKKIPYDQKRIEYINRTFLKSMVTLTSHLNGFKTFFVFGSLDEDRSLTSSMTTEKDIPGHYELLQAPYRFLMTPEGEKLRELCGDLPARVLLLVVTKPRIVYATNPSTITHFLDQVEKNWDEIRKQIKVTLKNKQVMKTVLALQDGNGHDRLTYLAILDKVDFRSIFPELQAVISWDGGYVSCFIDRLKVKLPTVEHIPMFSMSTETIETLPHRINDRIYFLPTMKGTLPEFMDEEGVVHPAVNLETGKVYSLVVTDEWGLQRYDTSDQFLVKNIVDGLPDLRFLKRRNVTSSLTGEKLTEEQVIAHHAKLRSVFAGLRNASLSLIPLLSKDVQGYGLAIIGGEGNVDEISQASEKLLCAINSEYASKVKSGRLTPVKARHVSMSDLAKLLGQENFWESQFKVMPLYEKPVRN